MTLRSMTGFGRGEGEFDGRMYIVELRCVNNRFFDLKMKLPRGYAALEERVRKLVSSRHLRGRVELQLIIKGERSGIRDIRFNKEVAKGYEQALRQLCSHFQIEFSPSVSLLTALPDIITQEEREEDHEIFWKQVAPIVEMALDACDEMRRHEGEILAEDLTARLRLFSETIAGIKEQVPTLVAQRQQAMLERVEKLLDNIPLDFDRLTQEVAILADKTDVTEEIVRLRSHIEQFSQFLDEDGAVGRRLDFLIQEFLREVNTLASKINDASIMHQTVMLKSELEKMREQVQNIE